MLLTATGRRTGAPRSVILAYIEDGPDLVTLAMNGGDPAEPAWWLNLQHDRNATVVLPDGSSREVTVHEARDAERDRLWARYARVTPHLDDRAARRGSTTAVVVLEPRSLHRSPWPGRLFTAAMRLRDFIRNRARRNVLPLFEASTNVREAPKRTEVG